MKYIRTKDIIFELSYEENGYLYTINGEIGCKPNEVIAQADTIEELCDKWIIIENGIPHILAYECDLLDKINNNEKAGIINTIGYGAIWAKGERNEPILKSVAKMNNKGELELL